MVAAIRHPSIQLSTPTNASIRQHCQKIRTKWTSEERTWRTVLASKKFAELLAQITDPRH